MPTREERISSADRKNIPRFKEGEKKEIKGTGSHKVKVLGDDSAFRSRTEQKVIHAGEVFDPSSRASHSCCGEPNQGRDLLCD